MKSVNEKVFIIHKAVCEWLSINKIVIQNEMKENC